MKNQLCPSPIPPWHRPVQSPLTNTIFGDGEIGLTFDTTYLDSIEIRMVDAVESPYAVVLPDGNYRRQIIRVHIEDKNINPAASATFLVTGTFNGFTSLKFTPLGFSAVLEWTGTHWSLIGGNAIAVA